MTKRSYAWRQRNGFAIEAREPVKSKYHRELWLPGPIRDEARRLAKEELRKELAAKNIRLDLQSHNQVERGIDVLLFNSEDIFLKRAKWNRENRS